MSEIKQIPNGPVQGNTYIIGENDSCYIIDPGYDYQRIIQYVKSKYKYVKAILLTHGHFDHCGAVDEVASFFNCKTYMNLEDMIFIDTPNKKSELPILGMTIKLETTILSLDDFNDNNVIVLNTPGHSKGSVCFWFKKEKALFSGDTLFSVDIGRVDLPGGSMKEMTESLKLLKTLPDDLTVYPGHEEITTLDKEKKTNMYLSRV
ncbi:MAG: MBL fold metallo-hydrolase [Bacilli bacterium]